MKSFYSVFLYIVVFTFKLFAQPQDMHQIAHLEKDYFSQSIKQARAVLPNNYDLKYCRAQWLIEPSVKYISGNVFYLF